MIILIRPEELDLNKKTNIQQNMAGENDINNTERWIISSILIAMATYIIINNL